MDQSFPIKGRYLVIIWLLPTYFYLPTEWVWSVFINETFPSLITSDSYFFWDDLVYYYLFYSIFLSVAVFFLLFYKLKWRRMFKTPTSVEYFESVKLTTFLFLFSWAAIYWVFYPLSFVMPEFVNDWLFFEDTTIYDYGGDYALFPNLLSFISLVILPAVIEELVFRGILLHRWCPKFGVSNAILLSSYILATMHPEPLGAYVFAIGMSLLYLKTQNLFLPILCHMLNNLAVWLFLLFESLYEGYDYNYTLEEFQADWRQGITISAIVLIWVILYIQSPKKNTKGLSLPNLN